MLLKTENLTKNYGAFIALENLNLTISPGEIVGLLGPNGSGKSTAIRSILGFLKPTSGAAWVDGFHCWEDSVAARQRISYLPGELRLYENMTGHQLLNFLCELRGKREPAEIDQLAKTLDIDLSRPIRQLSSGMKRKVALLVVLAPQTPLLILDEPTNTLDPTMRDELLYQLTRARERGQAVLFSSHVLSEVEEICDRVAVLQRGRLVHLQAMNEILQSRRVVAEFANGVPNMPPFPGIQKWEQKPHQLIMDYSGPLPSLLEWLGHQSVTNLTMEPAGLSTIYKQYHGNDA